MERNGARFLIFVLPFNPLFLPMSFIPRTDSIVPSDSPHGYNKGLSISLLRMKGSGRHGNKCLMADKSHMFMLTREIIDIVPFLALFYVGCDFFRRWGANLLVRHSDGNDNY
jgi:hypothetical protein